MILELKQILPLITPRGRAYAYFLLDYGPDSPLFFITFLRDSGQCWIYPQSQIVLEPNETLGILNIK